MYVVDESAHPSWRNLARLLRDNLLLLRGDINDLRAQRAWRMTERRWGSVTPEALAVYLHELWAQDFMRQFEYAFFLRCLVRAEVSTTTIVDMGGGYSYSTVVPMLLRLPNSHIISIDVLHHRRRSRYNVTYVTGNCTDTPLPNDSADVVALISTLEHVGLGRYGDPLDVHGDLRAMQEARRVLKPGGHVVVTVPYGYPTVVYNLHRIYDDGRFALATRGFRLLHAEYSFRGRLVSREESEAEFVHRHPHLTGGIMALLQKVE